MTLAEFARQFHRLLWERHSRPDEVQIFFVALLQPTMARAGVIFALLGLRVIVDVCDSINLLGTALSGHIGLQQTVRKMSSSLKMAPRRMHISYISERDAAADAGFDFGCKVAVVGPTAPRDILILANSSIGQIERFAISGDYRSEHTARGLRVVLKAWMRFHLERPEMLLHVYGQNVDILGEVKGAVLHGFAPELASIYEGRTAILVPNELQSGVPNKVVEAVAAQRPIVGHESLRELLDDASGFFGFEDEDSALAAIRAAADCELTREYPRLSYKRERE
ncbi:glycosyltransferase [Tardiphaga sp.]|uniref:glycosyltransferase n=1 Tax=Tardiphaga sp. TaxID=1926292 RepID=UPI0037D9CC47